MSNLRWVSALIFFNEPVLLAGPHPVQYTNTEGARFADGWLHIDVGNEPEFRSVISVPASVVERVLWKDDVMLRKDESA